ncbi:hypothetical protein KUTeg_021147 [Tegillarca granosa]|uniref:Protein kinase domain-containing protein n=1 Tax=Tegillarca granosa TaxID=220873 RepID=A0ABQ9EFE4_TEGGR|nr:hypothetical protein KUTeg_021147 [Tegillarca granosa]
MFEVPQKYQLLTAVGSGAYGLVCSAVDTSTNTKVAIKKLSRPFQSPIHAKRTYREIRMLKHMNHENIIGLLDVFTPTTTYEDFNDVYLVSPLMGADMSNILKTQKLSDDHYIHSAGIIHRDLKPSNIAVNEDCELKILDFGLARHTEDEMTGYVATRWYRAPEIVLNWMHYGQTDIDQLNKVLSLVGNPNEKLLEKINSKEARDYVSSLPKFGKKDFKEVFIGANPKAVDLLERLLDLDPDTRITAVEALAHPYLTQYADITDEPTAEPYDQSFEAMELPLEEWKSEYTFFFLMARFKIVL